MARRVALPRRTPEEVREALPALRQSRLADFDSCALMTKFSLEGASYSNHAQARGILFHRFAAEFLRTLWRTGEEAMPVEEAMAILYEVCAQREVPDEDVLVVPMRERRLIRIAAIKLASENEFRMDRLIDVERRLEAPVRYPDPETGEEVVRLVTGQPDALIADPPEGAVVLDWKTAPSPPPEYSGDREDRDAGVSYMGYFQQRVYAFLVMARYPSVQRVTLREFYVLKGVARSATVHRHQLEHVERELATIAEALDRAIAGGTRSRVWRPSPGRHCAYCPKPHRCPIAPEERAAAGGIATLHEAKRAAGEFIVADRARLALRDALKSIEEVHGPIPVRDGKARAVIGWEERPGGRRRFGVHVPPESDRGPADESLEDAFREAAERKRSAA